MKNVIYRVSVRIKEFGERKGSVSIVKLGLMLMKKAMK